MTKKTQFLQQLGHSWYVRIKVPREAQAIIGNTHLRKALGTRDLDEANERKWAYIKAFKDQIALALKRPVVQVDELREEALRYREEIMEAHTAKNYEQVDVVEEFAVERAKEIEEKTGDEKRATDWYTLATAKSPFLSELMDKWLEAEPYKEQTKRQHKAALQDLLTFLKGDTVAATVTADVATDFVEDWLRNSGKSYNTQRRKLDALVGFWKWLGRRRYVERGFNPWTGFVLSKVRTPKKTPDKRPYRDEELLRLFAKRPAYEGLAEIMVLGLYTGARIDELCSLRMKDVERKVGAYFMMLHTGKGKTRVRTVAVSHAAPSAVLESLWNPANPAMQLFPSFKPGGYDGKLSWAVSKAFGRHRDALKLPREVDFHSFRRTLMTALENLGVDQVATARYVGHTLPTLAFKVYSGGSTEKTNREIARRISYCSEVEAAVARFVGAVTTDVAIAA